VHSSSSAALAQQSGLENPSLSPLINGVLLINNKPRRVLERESAETRN